ncbi:MAG: ABC-2 family transporter protein [Thermotogae bacterium]|nr:ABC-2 family transporter protein [Thermotogota bacterium]
MKKCIKLLNMFFKQSTEELLIYRSTAVITLIFSFMFFAVEIIFGFIVYSYSSELAGLNFNQYMNLIFTATLITNIYQFFFTVGHENLSDYIVEGELDYILIRPVNSYFYYAFNRQDIPSLINILVTTLALIYNNRLNTDINFSVIVFYIICILLSVWTLFLVNQIVVCVAFWKEKVNKLLGMPEYFYDASSRPLGVYPGFIRFILSYIIPFGIITNDSSLILTERFPLVHLIYIILWNIIITIISVIIWKKGLKHYASAN